MLGKGGVCWAGQESCVLSWPTSLEAAAGHAHHFPFPNTCLHTSHTSPPTHLQLLCVQPVFVRLSLHLHNLLPLAMQLLL